MKFLAYCRNKFKSEQGFSLLEMLIVITISSLLAVIFLQLIVKLYQNNDFFIFQNTWQLDAYLAVDFMADQIKNSQKIELINQREVAIFSYYDQKYQWLKFSLYQTDQNTKLGRAVGSTDINHKEFGRNLSLLDNIQDINFVLISPELLKISLSVGEEKNKLVVTRLIKIN
ncbi:MAG: prepilin-type N-terminal cleavage/methylation domain-containing protein [Halanaerobium sp.]